MSESDPAVHAEQAGHPSDGHRSIDVADLMRTRPAIANFQRVLLGKDALDDAAIAWLRRGFQNFLGGDLPLHRGLGLPGGARLKTALRDFWLAEAFDLIGGSFAELHRAAEHFEHERWPAWCHLMVPPSSAPVIEGSLFYARKAAEFPTTRRAYSNIFAQHGNGKQKPRMASPRRRKVA